MATAIAIGCAALGWAAAAWSYYQLQRWARDCKMRIAISYKGKVKIDAPLVEWMLWGRQAAKDRAARKVGPAKMLFHGGGTSVAIVQPPKASTVQKMRHTRENTQGGSSDASGRRQRQSRRTPQAEQ